MNNLTFQEVMLKALLEEVPANIYWKDKNGVYLGCNNSQANALGCTIKDIIGKTDKDLPWSKNAPSLMKVDQKILSSQQTESKEEVVTIRKQKLTYFSQKIPLLDGNGESVGILGVSTDITDKKRIEQLQKEKEILQEKYNQSKLIAASIGHEVRTPLYAIELLNEVLKEGELSSEQLQAISAKIEKHTHAGMLLIEMLVKKAQQEISTADFSQMSMKAVVEKMIATYPFKSVQTNIVQFDGEGDFVFNGSELYMLHVLYNLTKNALMHLKDADSIITISLKPGEKMNTLVFEDTGRGISKTNLPKIFDAFFTKARHGSGIGLAFTKMVIQTFGGEITCKSVENQYTRFTITLPKC